MGKGKNPKTVTKGPNKPKPMPPPPQPRPTADESPPSGTGKPSTGKTGGGPKKK